MQNFKGRTAVVTGGGSGIGRAMSLAFASEGMHVAIADIDIAAAEGVRDELLALGVRSIAAHCNVASREEVDALADAVFSEFGSVHVLCNNAGVVRFGPLKSTTPADWECHRSGSASRARARRWRARARQPRSRGSEPVGSHGR